MSILSREVKDREREKSKGEKYQMMKGPSSIKQRLSSQIMIVLFIGQPVIARLIEF